MLEIYNEEYKDLLSKSLPAGKKHQVCFLCLSTPCRCFFKHCKSMTSLMITHTSMMYSYDSSTESLLQTDAPDIGYRSCVCHRQRCQTLSTLQLRTCPVIETQAGDVSAYIPTRPTGNSTIPLLHSQSTLPSCLQPVCCFLTSSAEVVNRCHMTTRA